MGLHLDGLEGFVHVSAYEQGLTHIGCKNLMPIICCDIGPRLFARK